MMVDIVVQVFVDLRFYIQIKNNPNIENKILQVDGEAKL